MCIRPQIINIKKIDYFIFGNNLNYSKYKMNMKYEQSDCSICLDELQIDKVSTASCGHVFHSKCMKKFIKVDDRCPLCRTVIYNDEIRINRKRGRWSFSVEDDI
jgi:hypothetical protein